MPGDYLYGEEEGFWRRAEPKNSQSVRRMSVGMLGVPSRAVKHR